MRAILGWIGRLLPDEGIEIGHLVAILLVFAALAAAVGGGYVAGYVQGKPTGVPEGYVASDEAEAYAGSEYYRGVYDMCVWVAVSLVEDPDPYASCLEAVEAVREKDWRGQPSEGYEPRLPAAPDEVPAVPEAPVDQDWQAQPREDYGS